MTIRRQLVNFGSTCTDFRIGSGLLDELPRILKNVVGSPKRAHAVISPGTEPHVREAVRRALADAGFTISITEAEDPSVECALDIMRDLARAGITSDDLVLGIGSTSACSLSIWCSRSWCSGTACVLIPTELDGMASLATGMVPLSCADAPGRVSVQPHVDIVACDLDLVSGLPVDRAGLGYTVIVRSALSESRRVWDKLAESIDRMLEGDLIALIDLLCMCQTSRSGSIKSSSPSARSALNFGLTTASALKKLLGASAPWYLCVAEGMRFEARVAHDAFGLDPEVIFDQDDAFEALGVGELAFDFKPEDLVEALRAERFRASNRFMLPLPKFPGTVRLTTVDDDVLERHAAAFVAARRA